MDAWNLNKSELGWSVSGGELFQRYRWPPPEHVAFFISWNWCVNYSRSFKCVIWHLNLDSPGKPNFAKSHKRSRSDSSKHLDGSLCLQTTDTSSLEAETGFFQPPLLISSMSPVSSRVWAELRWQTFWSSFVYLGEFHDRKEDRIIES